MHSFVLGLISQDRNLWKFSTREIRLSQDRLALRAFVDDGLHLVALIDEFMPIVRVHGGHDLLTLVKTTVEQVHDGCCPRRACPLARLRSQAVSRDGVGLSTGPRSMKRRVGACR